MINFFANIFGYVLNAIYNLVQNYGIAIIFFSILLKLAMLPLSIKQQKSMKKNQKVQKEMKILQIKYKGNQEKINQEMLEIYKREKISPFAGCLTIIIQFVLLIAMFYLVRSPLTYMKKIDNSVIEKTAQYLKTEENIEFSQAYPQIGILKYVSKEENRDKIIEIKNENSENKTEENVEEEKIEQEEVVEEKSENQEEEIQNEEIEAEKINLKDLYINMNFLGLDLSKIPQENLTDVFVYIIPVLYVISSFISIKINNNQLKQQKEESMKTEGIQENEESKELVPKEDMSQEEMMGQMNKNMTIMLPILSVTVSLMAPLGLALYWLVNNIMMIIERILLNKIFSKEEEEDA